MADSAKPSLLVRGSRVLRRWKDEALRGVYGRSGPWARRARYPIPSFEPWRAKEVHLSKAEGVGDVLLCTPAVRELRRRNPGCRVHFYTQYPGLLRGLQYIDEVHMTSEAPANSLVLQYGDAIPPEAHLARLMGDVLGLEVSDVTPDCAVDSTLVERWGDAWKDLPRPHVVILRRAGNWTPNKNWQDESWVTLVDSLLKFGTVIEIGAMDEKATLPAGPYVDLRGRTNLEELVAAIAAADLYIGPDSGPMHIAAAVKTPGIVIAGGYINPKLVVYTGHTYFYTPVPCSPCWLQEPCPFDRKCLAAIAPAAVERLVRELWEGGLDVARVNAPKIFNVLT
jgi:hypothetical protein